jgi:hypothetical protein
VVVVAWATTAVDQAVLEVAVALLAEAALSMLVSKTVQTTLVVVVVPEAMTAVDLADLVLLLFAIQTPELLQLVQD